MQELVHKFGVKYIIIGASDSFIFANFIVGANAHISMLSNVYPKLALQIFEAVKLGNYTHAKHLQFKVMNLKEIFGKGPTITPYKEALRMRGLDVGTVSSPLRAMTEEEVDTLRESLTKLGALKPIPTKMLGKSKTKNRDQL